MVVETQSFTNEVHTALTKLKNGDTRVILGRKRSKTISIVIPFFNFPGNFNEYYAREIFCEAYRLEMYGRRYQWIIMGTYSSEWWKRLRSELNCTIDEIESALEQTILTDLLPLSTSGEITISGIVRWEDNITSYNNYFVLIPYRQLRNIFPNIIRGGVVNIPDFTVILTMEFGLSP